MSLDADTCYHALRARDRRFDGVFFVAVRTTGIYCRPICPARTPGRDRCEFFVRAAEAESAGYRACFRCRPELAPGMAPMDSIPRLVLTAAERIETGALDEASVETLARSLGVSERHLRRAMEAQLGVGPIELAQTRRVALARQLVRDTQLPLTDIAFAAGFSSVRRFNALFRKRVGCAPGAMRRPASRARGDATHFDVRLSYRAPYAWSELLAFLRARAIPGVEHVDDRTYRRTVALGGATGVLAVERDPAREDSLIAHIDVSLAAKLPALTGRLRALFDLDAQPSRIAEHLRTSDRLRASVTRFPGLRLPGAFDPFETAIRAVLGQQVSVRAATTLSARLTEAFGAPLSTEHPALVRVFPTVERIADARADSVQRLGLPRSRALTVIALARAVRDAKLDLSARADPAATIAALESIPGIGPWTAQYIAMRALRWPDAFPAGDLVIRKALGAKTERTALAHADAWRPWRAYAVMHLWHEWTHAEDRND